MGIIANRISRRRNERLAQAQATLELHGWRFHGDGMYHEDKGHQFFATDKRTMTPSVAVRGPGYPAAIEFVEWARAKGVDMLLLYFTAIDRGIL